MQIVRYGKNEKYTSHFDNKAGSFRRVATFMCYLSDQCEGGCTNFPKAEPLFLEPSFDEHGAFKPFGRKKKTVASEQHGVKIHPKLGRAILFFSISEEPFRENPLSLHEGQTVRKGEKFICTKWLTRTEESAKTTRTISCLQTKRTRIDRDVVFSAKPGIRETERRVQLKQKLYF